jgi:hypothetical protein
MEDGYPVTAALAWVFGWFFGALALFHMMFAWSRSPWRLGSRHWKLVDYWWLGATALSLIGLTGQARQMVAGNLQETSRVRVEGATDRLRDWVRVYSSQPTGLCRTLGPSPFFTANELAKEQAQFDEMCR